MDLYKPSGKHCLYRSSDGIVILSQTCAIIQKKHRTRPEKKLKVAGTLTYILKSIITQLCLKMLNLRVKTKKILSSVCYIVLMFFSHLEHVSVYL